MPLTRAIVQFLDAFAAFKTDAVVTALRSLSTDGELIDRAQNGMQLKAELTLIRRIAMSQRADPTLISGLERIVERVALLQTKYDELSHAAVVAARGAPSAAAIRSLKGRRAWTPTLREISACIAETTTIHAEMLAFAHEFRRREAA